MGQIRNVATTSANGDYNIRNFLWGIFEKIGNNATTVTVAMERLWKLIATGSHHSGRPTKTENFSQRQLMRQYFPNISATTRIHHGGLTLVNKELQGLSDSGTFTGWGRVWKTPLFWVWPSKPERLMWASLLKFYIGKPQYSLNIYSTTTIHHGGLTLINREFHGLSNVATFGSWRWVWKTPKFSSDLPSITQKGIGSLRLRKGIFVSQKWYLTWKTCSQYWVWSITLAEISLKEYSILYE